MGDAGRIRQVLLNLGANAIKFTGHGHVELAVQWSESPEPNAIFSVSDSGIGIAEDKLPSLFEKFTQADGSTTRKYGGTGLGLAISQQLAMLMGGGINVESVLHRGSTFTFSLPLAHTSEETTDSGEQDALPATSFHAARVLLVEDNPINQKVAKRLLEKQGFAVDLANNGAEGVAMWTNSPYDLLFMDCQMPEMDGFEATEEIRRLEGQDNRPGRTPIIALTANTLQADKERCFAVGMDDFIPKPIPLETLNRVLQKWARRAAGERES
jgi:CheY-like chemotaxis protein